MLTFRRAEAADIEALAKARIEFLEDIYQKKAPDGLYQKQIDYLTAKLPISEYVSFIATDGEEIIGTSGILFFEQAPNFKNPTGKNAYIQNMYTKPAYRGRGVAKKLFDLVLDEAKSRGCSKVGLNATEMGRPLYEKFGFQDSHGDMELLLEWQPDEPKAI